MTNTFVRVNRKNLRAICDALTGAVATLTLEELWSYGVMESSELGVRSNGWVEWYGMVRCANQVA